MGDEKTEQTEDKKAVGDSVLAVSYGKSLRKLRAEVSALHRHGASESWCRLPNNKRGEVGMVATTRNHRLRERVNSAAAIRVRLGLSCNSILHCQLCGADSWNRVVVYGQKLAKIDEDKCLGTSVAKFR